MSNLKHEKLIIVGPSGSGKDYLLRGLVNNGLKYSPKFTTRPKRQLEKEGIDYYFITNDQFEFMNSNDEVKVYQSFNINDEIWYYGISKECYENNQVFIMTPNEISQMTDEDLKNAFIVYLDIDIDIRRDRISRRNDNNDSIERRIQSDEVDFKKYNKYDLKITDPDFESKIVYDFMN